MAVLQTIRRGIEADLPRLQIAELALTTDTEKLLIGTGSGNKVIATLSDVAITSYWNNEQSSGRLYGGEISDNGDGTVRITSGAGLSKNKAATLEDIPLTYDDGQAADVAIIGWVEIASATLTENAINTIYYSKYYNQVLGTTDESNIDEVKDFILGRVYREGTNLVIRNQGHNAYNFRKTFQAWAEDVFSVRASKGSLRLSSTDLHIAITAGRLWVDGVTRFTLNSFDSSGLTDRFTAWRRDGAGGWNQMLLVDQLDPNNYDDNSGVLQPLSDGAYTVHWVYILHNGEVHTAYGQQEYTLIQAINSQEPSELPGLLEAFGVLLGKVIIEKGASSAFDTYVAIDHRTVFRANEGTLKQANKYIVAQSILSDRTYDIEHNLGTKDILVSMRERATGNLIEAPITIVDENSIQLHIKDRLDVTYIDITIIG